MMKAKEIAKLLSATEILGNPETEVKTVDDLRGSKENALVFISDPAYIKYLSMTKAVVLLADNSLDIYDVKSLFLKDNKAIIVVPSAYNLFVTVISKLEPEISDPRTIKEVPVKMISDLAQFGDNVRIFPNVFIGDDVIIDDNTVIYPGSVILSGVKIGKDCLLYPNVTIYPNTVLGDRVIIGSSTVIGSDGFGFIEKNGKRIKIPHAGRVLIGDDVEIGSNSSIDRGTVGETKIGNGTKIDNLVQVAHNCTIGDDCILCGMVGLSGTTVIGDRVIMAANSGTKGHMTIGDDCLVTARTSVTKDLEKGSQVKGYPARNLSEELKIQTLIGKLPEIYKLLKKIEKQILKES